MLLYANHFITNKPIVLFSGLKAAFSGTSFPLTASKLAESYIDLLTRQLKRYLTGDLSEPSESLIKETAAAPVHNMHAERVLGMTDAQFSRAPNASTDFIDAKVNFIQFCTLYDVILPNLMKIRQYFLD